MEDFPKNQENVGENSGNGAEALSEMPPFEEHKASAEKRAELGEKYYQQAEAERDRWVKEAREEIETAKKKTPEGMIVIEDQKAFMESGQTRGYREFDDKNPEDIEKFENYKKENIQKAEDYLHKYENVDLDKLAKCCKNKELIGNIAVKLKNNEDFNDDEKDFLGDYSDMIARLSVFDMPKFETPDVLRARTIGLVAFPSYRELLDIGKEYDTWPDLKTVARAQMREMMKRDQLLLDANEEVQGALENMEERRIENPFAGETNINSETGETRTFTLEDNYPRLENESEEDYASRLRRIGLKTRLAEKRQ